jgi:hypothetical protein
MMLRHGVALEQANHPRIRIERGENVVEHQLVFLMRERSVCLGEQVGNRGRSISLNRRRRWGGPNPAKSREREAKGETRSGNRRLDNRHPVRGIADRAA